MKHTTRELNPKKCMKCGRSIMSHLHFFAQAGFHKFVPQHKHHYQLRAVQGLVFRNYHFECDFPNCFHVEVISKHFFWHGMPKLKMPPMPKVDYTAMGERMKKAMSTVGVQILSPPPMEWRPDMIITPPHGEPSSHFTVRTDGTIEDHTPWLDMRPRNNQHHLGVEFDD